MNNTANIGVTAETHTYLTNLKEQGVFAEMLDAYRFGAALGVARGRLAPRGLSYRTVFHIGSVDPDGSLRSLMVDLNPDDPDPPEILLARYAEYGVEEMGRAQVQGTLRIADLLESAQGSH